MTYNALITELRNVNLDKGRASYGRHLKCRHRKKVQDSEETEELANVCSEVELDGSTETTWKRRYRCSQCEKRWMVKRWRSQRWTRHGNRHQKRQQAVLDLRCKSARDSNVPKY